MMKSIFFFLFVFLSIFTSSTTGHRHFLSTEELISSDSGLRLFLSDLLDKDDISDLPTINWDKVIKPSGETITNLQDSRTSQRAPVFIVPIIAIFKSLAAKAVIIKSSAIATKAFLALKGFFTTKTATAIGSKVIVSLIAAKVGQVTEKLLTRWFSDKVEQNSIEIIKEWNQLKDNQKDSLLHEVREAINKSALEANEKQISEEERKQLAAGLVNTKLNELRRKFAESVVDKIMSDLDEESFVKEVLNDAEIKKNIA